MEKRDKLSLFLIMGICLYYLSICWLNFHSRQWYSFDIYSDSLLARLMVEQGTIFPENWVFGNQYYVIATPVLSAIVYAICHNSVLSLAIASSMMMILILLTYLWAIGPFVQRREKLAGLFCLSGAVVLGNSASSYVNGLEYFYTMASFYACYILSILLTLGVFFRIRTKRKVNPILFVISLLFSFALGMQSLRGTLVLYLALLAYSVLMLVIRRNEKKSLLYSLFLVGINLIGVFVMKLIPAKSAPIISDVELTTDVAELVINLKLTGKEFLTITGLNFFMNGIKWMPLFMAAVFSCVIVILAIAGVVKRREGTLIEGRIIFCIISISAVFVVGVFLFRVRAIYFFVWYLLVIFSFIFDIKEYTKMSKMLIFALCITGTLNYVMNFLPDFLEYKNREEFYQEKADELVSEGIDCVYYDLHSSPLLAVYSNDRIISGTVHLDPSEKSGGLMYPVKYLNPIDVFKNAEQFNSYLVFSNWTFDYLKNNTSEEYIEKLESNLVFVKQVSYGNEELTFYRFSPSLLNYKDSN